MYFRVVVFVITLSTLFGLPCSEQNVQTFQMIKFAFTKITNIIVFSAFPFSLLTSHSKILDFQQSQAVHSVDAPLKSY